MRLLIVAGCPSESNSAYHVVNLATRLNSSRVDVRVEFRTLVQGPSLRTLVGQGISVLQLGQSRGKFDFVMCWGARNPQRTRAREVNAAHFFVHLEDNDFHLDSVLQKSSARSEAEEIELLLAQADFVTGLSPKTKKLVPRGTDYLHFYPGTDDLTLSDMHSVPKKEREKPWNHYVLYAGNVTPFVLEDLTAVGLAISQLNVEAGKAAQLLVTGRDYTGKLAARLGGKVLLGGFLGRQTVWRMMRNSLANVQTAGDKLFDDFRFPSKIPEYMVSGTPMVSSFENQLLADWGEEAFIRVEPFSVDSWRRGIGRALGQSSAERVRLVTKAREVASRDLRWNDASAKLLGRLED